MDQIFPPDSFEKFSFSYPSLQYPRHGTIGENTIENWWGNTVYMKTADQQALPLRKVVPGEFFGLVVRVKLSLNRHGANCMITAFPGLDRGDVCCIITRCATPVVILLVYFGYCSLF